MNDFIKTVEAAHALYCELTGQKLSLRYDRQRLWHDLFEAGFNAADLQSVVKYLQKEIRAGRRNVGALKLSNLLQLDRFEEDLNISRVRLRLPPAAPERNHPAPPPPPATTAEQERLRLLAREAVRRLREQLGRSPSR